jgi:hypothetical protein
MDLAVYVADVYGQLLKCLMRFDEWVIQDARNHEPKKKKI